MVSVCLEKRIQRRICLIILKIIGAIKEVRVIVNPISCFTENVDIALILSAFLTSNNPLKIS
jgi:hypothetical protein